MITPVLLVVLFGTAEQSSTPSSDSSRWFVQPAVVFTVQPASSETYHRVSPNLSGHAFGVAVEAGGFLTRSLALEGAFVFGGTVSAPQRFSYSWSEDYIAGNRDLLLEELLRWRPGGTAAFDVVAGGGLAITEATYRSIVGTYSYSGGTYTSPDRSVTLYGLTLTGGVDATIPVARALAVVPTFRLRWTHRPETAGMGWVGVGAWTINAGVGLRAGF